MPDTLKAQHIARLTTRRRACSRTWGASSARSSRTRAAGTTRSAGSCDAASRAPKYGEAAATRSCRNDFYRNAPRQFLIELGKYGLGERDLRRQRELLQQGGGRRRGQRCAFARGTRRPGTSWSCARRWTCWSCLTLPHPLDPRPGYAPSRWSWRSHRGARRSPRRRCRIARGRRTRAASHSPRLQRDALEHRVNAERSSASSRASSIPRGRVRDDRAGGLSRGSRDPRGADPAHRRPRRQPGRRHAVLQRARSERSLQRDGHDPRRRATSI